MNNIASRIRLEEEKSLLSFMEGRINVHLIQKLLAIKDGNSPDGYLPSYLKDYNFPLSEKIGADVHNVCRNVQDSVGLQDTRIEYLISGNPEINAASFFNVNYSDKNPHFVILNSGLLEILEEPELTFVVGHEIGHLVYQHTHFKRVIQFIYPEFNKSPYLLRSLYDLWCKLGEISADRIGLAAVKELEPAALAMFKLSSGPGQKHLKISYAGIIEMIDDLLGETSGPSFQSLEPHPSNPVRVKALQLFYESDYWKRLMTEQSHVEDVDLNKKVDELISVLKRHPGCDIDRAELEFLATAGFLLIASDENASEEEIDLLTNLLSQYLYLPHGFIQTLSQQENLYETLRRSAAYIVRNYPQRTRDLFLSLLPLIMRDRKLYDSEAEFALKIAAEELKIPFQEAVDLMLGGIRDLYTPMA